MISSLKFLCFLAILVGWGHPMMAQANEATTSNLAYFGEEDQWRFAPEVIARQNIEVIREMQTWDETPKVISEYRFDRKGHLLLVTNFDDSQHILRRWRWDLQPNGLATAEYRSYRDKEWVAKKEWVFDDNGQLTEYKENGEAELLYRYDDRGNCTAFYFGMIDALAMEYEYDGQNRLILTRDWFTDDPKGTVTTITYNEQGWEHLRTTPRPEGDFVEETTYDEQGREVRIELRSNGQVVQYWQMKSGEGGETVETFENFRDGTRKVTRITFPEDSTKVVETESTGPDKEKYQREISVFNRSGMLLSREVYDRPKRLIRKTELHYDENGILAGGKQRDKEEGKREWAYRNEFFEPEAK